MSVPDLEPEVVQGGTAWLVGDHVEARRHFRAAAQRGSPLGQYNLAMMLLYREGGPCDAAQAIALLGKSADAGIDLARDALNQMQVRTTAANKGRERPFPCRLPRKAHSSRLRPRHSLTGAEAKGSRNGAADSVCRDGSWHSRVASTRPHRRHGLPGSGRWRRSACGRERCPQRQDLTRCR